jgi:cell division protein FtsQ
VRGATTAASRRPTGRRPAAGRPAAGPARRLATVRALRRRLAAAPALLQRLAAARAPVRRPAAARAPLRRLAAARALRPRARSRVRLPALSARLKRRLLSLGAICLTLAAVYWFWFRDSGLVAVERVTVTGLTTDEAPRLRAALVAAAHSMTTLHLDRERLERTVEAYPVVKGLELSADFPNTLRIRVVEHHAAALVVAEANRVPVAGDGTVLSGLPAEGRLPTIDAEDPFEDGRLGDRVALRAVRVAAAAPAALRGRLEELERRQENGLVVRLREGPELIFGDATRVQAKWTAAARVLADKAAAGASYVDLRLPGRPAAGGLPAETLAPVAPADSAAAAGETAVPAAPANSAAAAGETAAPADPAAAAGETAAPADPATGTPPATTTPGLAPTTPAPPAGGTATAPIP